MTSVIIYICAVAMDVATTDRALRRHDSIRESHPIITRLFGSRPTRAQFALYVVLQSMAFILAAHLIPGARPEMLLVVAGGHLLAAVSNYRLERKTRD